MSDRDRQAIRDLIQDWAVWRDAGDWERFATVWHDDEVMKATWFQAPPLDPERLSAFPVGYRHLAYIQSLIGFDVKPDMPGLAGPEVTELYERGARWLTGETKAGERP